MKVFSSFIIIFAFLGSVARANEVCKRTPAVKIAIEQSLHKACDQITPIDLGKIYNLNLRHKGISALNPGDLQGLASLEDLDLENNLLTSLPTELFKGLTSLKTLELMFNKLSSLPEGIFQNLSSLQQLFLTENQLTALNGDIFHGLKSLIFLGLAYNQISGISEDVFASSNFPSENAAVDLRNNPLSSDLVSSLKSQLGDNFIF